MAKVTASIEDKVVRTNSADQIQPQANTIKSLLTSLTFLAGLVVVVTVSYFLTKGLLFTFTEMLLYAAPIAFLLLIIMPILVWSSVVLVPFNTIWILQRLGSKIKVKDAGVRIQIPFIDEVYSKQDLRRRSVEVIANEAPTIKGTTVNVKANLFYQLLPEDPVRLILEVEEPDEYIVRMAEVAIRGLISSQSIEELQQYEDKDKIINKFLDDGGGNWVAVKLEISDIEFPPEIREAMAKVEIAEKEAKAKVISANNEIEVIKLLRTAVREKLPDGTSEEYVLEKAMQLRTLEAFGDTDGVLPIVDIAAMAAAGKLSSK